jgi:predicted lysophospholipase L1 biosynthesis ABC-type transport system permease subunit
LPDIEVRNAPILLAVAATFCVAALAMAGIPLRLAADENLALRLREAERN